MTDTLREIEKGHEAKFKLDEETRFKIACRRDKLLGLWAAGQMGFSESEADQYARDLVKAALRTPGAGHNIDMVFASFQERGLGLRKEAIAEACERFRAAAEADVLARYPDALDSDHSPVGG